MTEIAALAIWTVYAKPKDYPTKYVARCFLVRGGTGAIERTDSIIIAPTLDELRSMFADMYLTQVGRMPGDDPVIVETWL